MQQQTPLNKLQVAPENSRKTNVTARQEELKASIKAYGLLQPLLVRPADQKGHFFVVDGQRRLLALKALAKDKVLKPTISVKCEQIDPEIAQELSLTANVQTQAMHPADQFDAFFEMSQKNISIRDISARFGISEKTVKQRLKLASVSPQFLAQYREGEMSLEQLEAFTLSEDQEKQETVWSQLNDWQKNPHQIKAMLTEKKVSSSDHRVRFITLEAYKKAGGHMEADLFSEDIYLSNLELIEKLVSDKVSKTAKAVEAEGWGFVEVSSKYEYDFVQQYNRIWPEPVELGDKDAERLKAVEDEIERLQDMYNEADADNQDGLDEKLDTLEIEKEQLEEKKEAYTKEQKANAGAYVSYRHGEIFITRGLVEASAPTSANKKEARPKKEISERLLERLTAHKTLALQDVLSNSPQIGFDLMLCEMVKNTFQDNLGQSGSCFHLRMDSASLPRDDESLKDSFATANRQKAFEKWASILRTDNGAVLYEAVSSMKQEQKMKLLAFCFAGCLDVVIPPKAHFTQSRQDTVNWLADLLKLDMTQYWKPTAALYFNHIAKDNILNAVKDVKGVKVADTLKKLKKSELAKEAENRLENSGWLPTPLQVGLYEPE
ncbi:ParB family protein [Roseivirga pacifica]|uniref:ParB family protein n=1 Tax=Roseivirga pacifica TaxID=1267423 RepID=A0A1I0MQX5_9BACT|nr:ParB/RepB/Spo0J family partition protein [Roseivirga pacifica]RKQ50623.1 ParB family protein [Roseivirga pacifica]SEV90976.1 ParB family protein [Roseivirga pacifica]